MTKKEIYNLVPVDSIPTNGSTNPVSSDGVFDGLALKLNINSPSPTGTVTLPSTTSIGTVSSTEIGFLDGVTSSIQNQINSITTPVYDLYVDETLLGTGVAGDPLRVAAARIGTVTSSATPTPDAALTDQFNITALAVNAVFAVPSGSPVDGQSLIIRIKDDGTSRTLGWNAIYRASTTFSLPTATTISKTMYIKFIYNTADSKWDAVYLNNGF
jgi:hypothetical protein